MKIPKLTVGTSVETETLDFKAVHWIKTKADEKNLWSWQAELAKDVAAFANTNGGHIVVGAKEVSGALVSFTKPLLPTSWEGDLRRIVSTWLIPEPSVDALPHAYDKTTGTTQLVIEVQPSVPRVVVRDPGDSKKRILIPYRRGTHTTFAKVEEIITMLSEHNRAMKLRFESVLEASGNDPFSLELFLGYESKDLQDIMTGTKWRIADVSDDTVNVRDSGGDHMVIPLAYVEAVWKDPHTGVWVARVLGTIAAPYRFIPRGPAL